MARPMPPPANAAQSRPAPFRASGGSLGRRETLAGLLFVSPMLIGVFALVLVPIVATLVLSFADWNFVQGWNGIKWIGFDNFRSLLDDSQFIRSVRNNGIFLLAVPVYMIVSMALAALIDRYVYLKGYFKVAYFMPIRARPLPGSSGCCRRAFVGQGSGKSTF